MARLFKEKIAICMACCSKLGQLFEIIPTKYTLSVNGLMTNTKFSSLKNIVDISSNRKYTQVIKTVFYIGTSIPFHAF